MGGAQREEPWLPDLCRAALGAGEGNSTLAEEIDLSERYLAIEQLRLRERNPSLPPEQGGVNDAGHAQRSIGHRLGYMFGPRARMVSDWDDGYYACEITLPLDRMTQ